MSFSSASHPSSSTPSPLVIVATIVPDAGSTTTDVLPHPEKMRFVARSYAMPVGPSQGASGHDASTFICLASITWMVLLPSLLTNSLPLPSLAAPSGPLSSSSTVPTIAPLVGSSATRVPMGRLWLVRMTRSEKSSYMMPSRPPGRGKANSAARSNSGAARACLVMSDPRFEVLQRPQERDDRLLLAARQPAEALRDAARLSRVPRNGVAQRHRRLVVHQARAQPHAPQRRGADFVLGARDRVERQLLPLDLIDPPPVEIGRASWRK